MPSRRIEYWIEWVDGSRMIADYPEAARRGGFTEQDISKREGLLDVCPPEHYTERRRFPSRETASTAPTTKPRKWSCGTSPRMATPMPSMWAEDRNDHF